MPPFYRFASRGVIIPFLKAVSRQKVEGLENLPRDGGFIAVANHLTDLDSLTTMRALVDVDIPAYSLAKSTLFEVPVLGHVFKAGGQIPVYRGTERAGNSLIEAERRLRQGDVVMIFPEGTLSRDPLQWPMTGKTGAARLAMSTGVPILPMGQWGAQHILDTMGGGGFRPWPRKEVRVLMGEPFTLTERFGSDVEDRAQVVAATAEIMSRITRLVEVLRGEKAPRPYDMRYDGDPGKDAKGRDQLGTRRPDPLPATDAAPAHAASSDAVTDSGGTDGAAPTGAAPESEGSR